MYYNKRLNELIADQNSAYFSSEAKDAIDCAIAFMRENARLSEALYAIANHALDARQCMLLAKSALPNVKLTHDHST